MSIKGRKMSSWLDKNKGFVLTFLALIVPMVLAFASVQSETKHNKEEICRIDEREKAETARSQQVDGQRTGQVARIETKLEFIQRDVGRIEKGQQEILRLLRKRND